LISISEIYG